MCSVMLVSVGLLVVPWAHAQSAADDPFAGVEEMIVTGTGTADLLAPASTSAVAFDSSELDSYGVDDIGDIAGYVPNLEITSSNATNASFFVRGVGLQDFGANASSAVPIFQDNIPRNPSATQLVGLFDIGGVSVLKGPQGSGNRRNASAGAILIQTRKPEPEFSGYANITLARIASVDARDANRYDFETAISAPIFRDIVSMRVSARYSRENPWFENGCANRSLIADRNFQRPPGAGPDEAICGETLGTAERSQVTEFLPKYIGKIDDFGFRGQIRIVPPDLPLDITFRIELTQLNRDSTVGQHIGANTRQFGGEDTVSYRDRDVEGEYLEFFNRFRAQGLNNGQSRRAANSAVQKRLRKRPLDKHPYRGDFDSPGKLLLDTRVASMNAALDLDSVDVELNAGFVDYRKSEVRDTDLSPNDRFASRGNDQAWEAYGSLDFRGEQVFDTPLEWNVGLYTIAERVKAFNRQNILGQFFRNNTFFQEIYGWGVYADARYEFLEGFTLAGGVRYNWERKDFDNRDFTVRSIPLIEESSDQRTWDAFTGFMEIRYDFNEDIGTYLKYSRGFKAGHYNNSIPLEAEIPGRGFADPEQIDAFEWGLQGSGWAGRVSGEAAIFFYNYSNYQVFRLTTEITGVNRVIQNASRARNLGAEIELTILPLEGFVDERIERLRIVLRGAWLDSNFLEFTNTEERQFSTASYGLTIDYTGNPLINAPNLQASGTITWPVDFDRFGTITPQYDFTWTDDTPFDPNQGRGEVDGNGNSRFPPYTVGNRAYILHNIRLTWAAPGDAGLQLSGWCRNLEDRRYLDFGVDISTFSGQMLMFPGEPRSCGADMRIQF